MLYNETICFNYGGSAVAHLSLLQPLFGITPPVWEEKKPLMRDLFADAAEENEDEDEEDNKEQI